MRRKKFASAVIALVLMLVMASSALAAGELTITVDPMDVVVAVGGDASFGVAAIGGARQIGTDYTYQWYANGSPVRKGGNGASITISNVTIGMNGTTYYCTVTDLVGTTVTSKTARLTVTDGSFTLVVVGGTGGGNYKEGAQVKINANPPSTGFVFDCWTSDGGGSFVSPMSASTTFIMPASYTTITAHYKGGTGGGSVTPITPASGTLTTRTLTDPTTGITVTGNMLSTATMTVTKNAVHQGDAACQTIQSYQTAGSLYNLYNIAITAPGVSGYATSGTLTISLPANAKNGTAVMIYHCHGGALQQASAYVSNGGVTVQNDTVGVYAIGGASGGVVTPVTPSGGGTVVPPQTGELDLTLYAVAGIALSCAALVCAMLLREKKNI